MRRLLLLALTTASLLIGSGASAHCDQNHGHQGASQTNGEPPDRQRQNPWGAGLLPAGVGNQQAEASSLQAALSWRAISGIRMVSSAQLAPSLKATSRKGSWPAACT